jgi:Zn-dependent membrane protease YugP
MPALVGWYAQRRLRRTYARWATVRNGRGILGADLAEALIAWLGLQDVHIALLLGRTGDHYDPADHTLVLSEEQATSDSVTALGIVAHEVLHAQQDAENYPLMRLRAWLGGRVGRYAGISMGVVGLGLVLRSPVVLALGLALVLALLLLGIVALPVERNASRRALEALRASGLAAEQDLEGARQVLQAAALTYLAGLLQNLGYLALVVMALAMARSWSGG